MSNTSAPLEVGQSASFSKTVSESDIYLFAGISGDLNPAHINAAYSGQSQFKGRIAHGMLSAGFISAVLGMQLPGPGTIYLSQTLKFLAPVYIRDTVTATLTVLALDREKDRATLSTVCTNQFGRAVVTGEAVVIPPRPAAEAHPQRSL